MIDVDRSGGTKMSVMQVVGSSRVNNTVYLAVGSIYWTAILAFYGQLPGISIETAITTAFVVIPYASIIGVLLWAFKIESWVIRKAILFIIPKFNRGKAARFNMATITLIIKHWQVSTLKPSTIPRTLQKESLRIIQSLNLRQDMEELFNLFWVVAVSYPLAYLFGTKIQVVQDQTIILSLAFIAIISIPVLYRRRKRMGHITDLALCQWMNELLVTDLRLRRDRRIADKVYPIYPYNLKFYTQLTEWTSGLISLIMKEDWEGFEENMTSLKSFLQTEGSHFLTQPEHQPSIFDDYTLDLLYLIAASRDESQSSSKSPLRTTNMAKSSVDTALKQLELFSEVHSKALEIKYDHRRDHGLIHDLQKEVDKFLDEWESIFRYFTRNTIELLSEDTLTALHELPYSMHQTQPIPPLKITTKSEDQIRFLIRGLIESANKGLIEIRTVVGSIQKLGFNPLENDLLDRYLKKDLHLFVEEDFGQSVRDLASNLRRFVDAGPIDENKVIVVLRKMSEDQNITAFRNALATLSVVYHDNDLGAMCTRIHEEISK